MEQDKELIKTIILKGTPVEKRFLYSFSSKDSDKKVLKKFELFTRGNFIRFFKNDDAPFHKDMAMDFILSYRGKNLRELAFRSASKTSLFKLFLVFVLENDEDHSKKYIKIVSRDLKNPKQIVTDVYNMCLELIPIYGNVFEKEGDKKREETMGSFTMKCGVKLTAGTVGQAQRGHVQDAHRPDWLIFDDVEDRESVSSMVITEGIIGGCDEAITGLDINGSWVLLGNYISENGVVQWFLDKSNAITRVTPIMDSNGVPTWAIFNKGKIEELRKDSLDFYGEYMCLKPDTLIHTKNGLRSIESLKVGDLVWTHESRLQKILKVFESEANDLIDVTVNGKVTTITKNHPVLVVVEENRFGWKNARELTINDLIVEIPHGKL